MFTVQRGSLNLTSATSGTISISAVDTAHSFIIAKTRATSSTAAVAASVSVRFTTTGSSISSLSWVKGGTATDVTLEWQVVSSPDIDVQHFYATLTNGNDTLDQAISTVDTSKTFILGTVDTAVNNASPQRYIPNYDITSTTNARISRFVTNDDINIAFHVVEFTDSTTVQRIGGNIANNQTTFSPTITAVDLSRSFIVGHYAPTNAQNANAAMYSFGSTTQVNVVRTGTSGTMAVVGFVVQLPSGFVTQSHAISGVSNPTAQAITAVGSTANTFTLATNTATGTGSPLDRRFITTSLSTTTNVNVHLGDTTDNVDAVLFVVEYSLQVETADVDPVSSSFSVVNTTATYESVQTATVAPVSSTFSIPNVTATYQSVQTASVASVTSLLSVVATTATFISLWTAGVAPVTANLSTVDPTATYEQINTATVEPVVSSFSVVDPTATYVQVETADVDPVTSTMSVVDPTATYQAVINAVAAPVTGTLSVVETTATHSQNATASVDPVSGVLSVVDTTATYDEVDSAVVEPIASAFSVVEPAASYVQVETASVDPVVSTLSVVGVTATYIQIETASVTPITATFGLADVTATHILIATAEVTPITGNYSLTDTTSVASFIYSAGVSPLVLHFSVTSITPTISSLETGQIYVSVVNNRMQFSIVNNLLNANIVPVVSEFEISNNEINTSVENISTRVSVRKL